MCVCLWGEELNLGGFEVFWGVGVVSAFEQLQLELGLGLSDRGVDG